MSELTGSILSNIYIIKISKAAMIHSNNCDGFLIILWHFIDQTKAWQYMISDHCHEIRIYIVLDVGYCCFVICH